MKKFIILLIAAASMSIAASAQSYNWGIGLRGGLYGGEITARHYLSDSRALNLYADISFNGWGWGIGGEYQFCFPVGDKGLEFYVGPGANIGTFRADSRNNFAFAVTAIAGLEYAFTKAPLAIALDYRPRFSLSFIQSGVKAGIGYADLALGLRFYF
ncbi:MAG: hypothetical protein MJY89_02025 [Bacteroidales bacterium]|nr:hypothetical protein [Bacteroidales bacterium]